VIKLVIVTNNFVKIHVVSDLILLQLMDGSFGVVDWNYLCWWISTVSVSLTQSEPQCVVDKACGLSANTLSGYW